MQRFTSSLFCFGLVLGYLLLPSFVHAAFDKFENWGFDQGGGFRQENFTDDDQSLILVDMAYDASDSQRVAVCGAMGSKWAVRVYHVGENGMDLNVSLTGDEDSQVLDFNFATATSLVWLDGKIICSVEHVNGNLGDVTLLTIDPMNHTIIRSKDLPGWDSLVTLSKDPDNSGSSKVWAVGSNVLGGLVQAFEVSESGELSPVSAGPTHLDLGSKPRAAAWLGGVLCVGVQDDKEASIVRINPSGLIIDPDPHPLINHRGTQNFFISEMVSAGDKLYVTGSESIPGNKPEDFFLIALGTLGGEGELQNLWSVHMGDVPEGTTAGREIGACLTALPGGGVVVGGNFRKTWILPDSNITDAKRSVLLASAGEGAENFESFLARYGQDGSLQWAQTSGFVGNDFILNLNLDKDGHALVLGNRRIDGGFGPYLGKVRLDGNEEKNAPFVNNPNSDNNHAIFWDPPKSIRFAEPMGSEYFSARALGVAEFKYSLEHNSAEQETPVAFGQSPIFTPGEDLTLTARLFRGQQESNSSSRKLKALKGRPYLKIFAEEIQDSGQAGFVQLTPELFGIHPLHVKSEEKVKSLLSKVKFQRKRGNSFQNLPDGMLRVSANFSGIARVEAVFDGDSHYEPTSRMVNYVFESGKLTDRVDGDFVSLQVRDLDGWQIERTPVRGTEVSLSATQGFGSQRKFNRWTEFSGDLLRTARVQNPFSINTSVIADEDMTLFARYNFSFSGTVINGYLANSLVFLDLNFNEVMDDGEPFAFTDQGGFFEIEITEEEAQALDANQNDVIDSSEAKLIVIGGQDVASNIDLQISYSAPPSYKVITAVSTLVNEVIELGYTEKQAAEMVNEFLHLPEGVELSEFEPLASIFETPEKSKAFLMRSTQLANLFNEGSRFVSSSTGNTIDRVKSSNLVVETLAEKIIDQIENDNEDASVLSLSDSGDVVLVVSNAREKAALLEPSPVTSTLVNQFEIPSARAHLAQLDPGLSQIGEARFLDVISNQIASANQVLEEMGGDSSVDVVEFKSLASVSQVILEDRGVHASNTLEDAELSAVSSIDGEHADKARQILDLASPVEPDFFPPDSSQFDPAFSRASLRSHFRFRKINAFAPILQSDHLVSPDDLNPDLSVGGFTAIDPEGMPVSYHFIGNNPDFDLDGIPLLSIQSGTGEVTVLDFDDLLLLDNTEIHPTLRVSDPFGLYADHSVSVDLESWSYLVGRPRVLESIVGIMENEPAGTLVHTFPSNDPRGEAIHYQLVFDEGFPDNQFFDMSTNGQLKSKEVFDFEVRDEYEIFVRSTNQLDQFFEKSIIVAIGDVVAPIVETHAPQVSSTGKLEIGGRVLDSGGSTEWSVGVLVGLGVPFNGIEDVESKRGKVFKFPLGQFENQPEFIIQSGDLNSGIYYFMAYAENSEGAHYGLLEKIEFKKPDEPNDDERDPLTKATKKEDFVTGEWLTGVWHSFWFGSYLKDDSGWWCSEDLGWIFPSAAFGDGMWLWKKGLNWLWTKEGVYPYLYSNDSSSWYYFYGENNQNRMLYDYKRKKWIFLSDFPEVEPIKEILNR